MLSKAISLTAQYFEKKYDKGGKPYILHCLFVMNEMPKDDSELQQIAVMHDLIEDTEVTYQTLENLGFSLRVCDGVLDLTHFDNVPYSVYIKYISKTSDAVKVKLADLRHNSDITRITGIKEIDLKRLEKYHKAYKFLENVIKQDTNNVL